MLHWKIPASLKHMKKPHHVGTHIGIRIVDAVTHAGLRPQVHHHLRHIFLKKTEHVSLVPQISFDKSIVLIFPQDSQAVFFQFYVIVIVQIIETDDPGAFFQKASGQMETDKPGAARHQIRLACI